MIKAGAAKNGHTFVLCLAICLSAIHVCQAKIILSRYISPNDLSLIRTTACEACSSDAIIQTVYGDDGTVTPFIYTYCRTVPVPRFSLNVVDGNQLSVYIQPTRCLVTSFVALDTTKTTPAAQFYIDCKQAAIYKCQGNLVFDEALNQCVPGGFLVKRPVVINSLSSCDNEILPTALSTFFCESLLNRTMPSVCAPCLRPFNAKVFNRAGFALDIDYTYCADNDAFTIDYVQDSSPRTYFIPDCRGRALVPIDATRTTRASRFFWSCRLGLMACDPGSLFDPNSNECSALAPNGPRLPDGLTRCPKTCGVYPPFASYAAVKPYSPAPYAPPRALSSPITAYGK